ncbi:protein shisa-4 [Protopterus annectens]|uniref:protein shisa-4 n=1 Tax=Protopterus annectens TaxID=7888 RepID=UPI001CFBC4E1|nr:protein shisa-4 [Protopterus annectens]
MTLSSGLLMLSWPIAAFLVISCVSEASANEDCLWYTDRNGTMHPGFDCPFYMFCCGDCHRRRCCTDPLKLITEREQKQCMVYHFGPKAIAGIASAILLFLAIIATVICCFMCSCCYLYQRRQQSRIPLEGQTVQMANYPVQPKPTTSPFYPENQGYAGVPTYPVNAPSNPPYPQQNLPYPQQNLPYPQQHPAYPAQNPAYPAVYNPTAPPPYAP